MEWKKAGQLSLADGLVIQQKTTFYDDTGATHPTLTNETFSYDKVGNRLSTQASATPWTYNTSDQLLTTPEATYQYNANGHTKNVDYTDTALPDMAYSYDARERLKRVLKTDDGSEIQSNRYDYNNRRLVKTTASGTVYFLYSVYGLEAEFDASGNLVQGYFFGSDVYSTNPILTYKPNTSNGLDYHYYHNDHLFTPQRLTDSSGALSWSADYSAFGETTITKETITNNLRFPGQYYDTDIKLAQNYYRDYSAELGRYVESDPIGLDGGVNFYGYVEQNPYFYYDFNGRYNYTAAPPISGGFWAGVRGGIKIGGRFLGPLGWFITGGILVYEWLNDECNEDRCYERYVAESSRCRRWYGQSPPPDIQHHYRACMQRASTRFDLCNRGIPNEPEEYDPWAGS